MGNVRKEKNFMIIEVEANKVYKFDFNTETLYGLRGKPIRTVSTPIKDTLRESETFLSKMLLAYLLPESQKPWRYMNVRFNIADVEKIYSLNSNLDEDFVVMLLRILDREPFELKDILQVLSTDKEAILNMRSNEIVNLLYSKKFKDIDERLLELIRRKPTNTQDEDILANASGILWALDHEYIDEFFTSNVRWGNASLLDCQTREVIYNYIADCKAMNEKPIWKNVLKMASIIKRERTLKERYELDESTREYQYSKPLFFENEEFEVIIPTTFDEFKAEADYQQNCVCAYYFPKVQKKETHVVFIRKKSDIETPYITCEVDNYGFIVQYLTRFNNRVNDLNGLAFKKEYTDHLRKTWN